mmetsp:Transcript_41619/g.107754  ORF Transcript_41619/g.107754 Transcript_41619/m.107754 type:complete len:288 (+) Transcript_41619:430-1293(+)
MIRTVLHQAVLQPVPRELRLALPNVVRVVAPVVQVLQVRPVRLGGLPHDPEYLLHLVSLKRTAALLLLLPLKQRPHRHQLREYAASSPDIDLLGVVLPAQQQLRGSVPDGDHHTVLVHGPKRRLENARQAKVGDLHPPLLLAVAHHEDVAGLQVSVDDPVGVQVVQPVQQLPHDRLDHVGVKGLGVALVAVEADHLVQVVLRIVKCEVQGGLHPVDVHRVQSDDVWVQQLPQQHDFADRRGRHPLALLGGLERLDRKQLVALLLVARQVDDAVGALAHSPHHIVPGQ